MSNALVVGGSSGLGLSIALNLSNRGYHVYIMDKNEPLVLIPNSTFIKKNLVNKDYTELNQLIDVIDSVYITAGIGRLNYFSDFTDYEIDINFRINTYPTLYLTKMFFDKLLKVPNFKFIVITSIAGIISSPLYALYSSTKGALHKFIESVNAELKSLHSMNKIFEVAPGHINGTAFHGKQVDLTSLEDITEQILLNSDSNAELFIPKYEEVYKDVINRYNSNPRQFSLESIEYKLSNNNLEIRKKIKVGYLSGTFDLFHIGHLNLIERAKQYCDYLVVGLHKDGSHKNIKTAICYDERKKILESIKYVDEVIESFREDSDAYDLIKYDYLFVGSDYKGTDRFNRYESILTPLGVKIIYFPYTTTTSSTELRKYLSKENE